MLPAWEGGSACRAARSLPLPLCLRPSQCGQRGSRAGVLAFGQRCGRSLPSRLAAARRNPAARKLKAIHTATHPGKPIAGGGYRAPESDADDADLLLATLAIEAEEEA